MDSDNLTKLNQHRVVLIQNMDGMRVADHLVALSIFNDCDAEEIQKLQDREDRNRRILYILKTKGAEAFHQFLVALCATNQHSLATLLDGQNHTGELQKIQKVALELLKQTYSTRFRKVYPFSLPFTFDVVNTWIPLALKEDSKDSPITEDHSKLLENAFNNNVNMLIIEGDPGTGKTSLMKRLAYEWAIGNQELLHYDVVVYIEFREVQKPFTTIEDLVLGCSENQLKDCYEYLKQIIKNNAFYNEHRVLLLMDGYDELSVDNKCSELSTYLTAKEIYNKLMFDIVLTTRKGYLSNLRGREGRFVFADILGFTTDEQKKKYISNHFSLKEKDVTKVYNLLKKNKNLNKLADIPLFLTFICLVHEYITVDSSTGAILGLYCNIIRYLLDRHQQDFPDRDIPELFGYKQKKERDKSLIIQKYYYNFPQLHYLGCMALHNIEKTVFLESDLEKFALEPVHDTIFEKVGLIRKEEKIVDLERIVEFFFLHRSIQEFLAAFSFFFSCEKIAHEIIESKLVQKDLNVNEFQMFLRLFAEADPNKIPIDQTRQQDYLEWSNTLAFPKVQAALRELYLIRFRSINPFSLPFTFDIEKTWVSMALKEDTKDSQATEDHAKLLKRAFKKAKMLIIEGDPATGKTSLMQRLACEWAQGKQELSHYDLVLYVAFREVCEQAFESIADLVLTYTKTLIKSEEFQVLQLLLNNKSYCAQRRILLLLDGYDESSFDKQCSELSKFLLGKTTDNSLLFNIVVTTRKGYLSHLRGYEGRFVFAEVLGFTTNEQKKKYIENHFSSVEDPAENIKAVHHLLKNNTNMDKLAETPLFLTFICLVHEEIKDGTLVELYCKIIWWLIDRHQRDFPGRDVPALFGYQSDSDDKVEIIQEHYLQFPQLHCLARMALIKLKESVFQQSDIDQFNMKPIQINRSKQTILEYVGLLRKEKYYGSHRLTTTFSFPHRTIQEFLAALYCFISHENTDQWVPNDSIMTTYQMNEYERFLLRIALSKQANTLPKNVPINATNHQIYCARMKTITWLDLDLTFDAFNTTAGLNSALLNWFLSQCTNIQKITFNRYHETTSVHQLALISLPYLHSLDVWNCILESNSQLSFTNCPSLKELQFMECEIESSASIDFSELPTLDRMEFYKCTIDLNAWQSITDGIASSSVKQLTLSSDFFQKEPNSPFFIHLNKCASIQEIQIFILNDKFNEEQVTTNLCNLAREMNGLKCITIYDIVKNIKESNKRIQKAGQERDPHFRIGNEGEMRRSCTCL